MPDSHEFTFAVEPVAWSRPRVARSGHMFNAPKMRLAQQDLKWLMKSQFKRFPLAGPLRVGIVFSITKPKSVKRDIPAVKPDIDNLIKLVIDAGNKIIWEDDNLIIEITARKEYGEPRIRLTVSEL